MIYHFPHFNGTLLSFFPRLSQFSVLLVVIFVIQVVVGVASYIMRSEVEDFLRQNMFKSMTTYNITNQGMYRTWNVIQHDVSTSACVLTLCACACVLPCPSLFIYIVMLTTEGTDAPFTCAGFQF